jgi:ATP phosphoribosyltransferase
MMNADACILLICICIPQPNRLDVAQCTSLPITLVFLPAADIASYVGEGNVDAGITGLDVVQESDVDVDIVMVRGHFIKFLTIVSEIY